jgi:hypothetical protein
MGKSQNTVNCGIFLFIDNNDDEKKNQKKTIMENIDNIDDVYNIDHDP